MNKKMELTVVNFNDGIIEDDRIKDFTPYFEYETEDGYFRFVEIELASWYTNFILPVNRGDILSVIRDGRPLIPNPIKVLIGGYEGSVATLREVTENGELKSTSEIAKYFACANGSHYLDAALLRDGDRVVVESAHEKLEYTEEKRSRFLQILKMETRRNKPLEERPCVFAFK